MSKEHNEDIKRFLRFIKEEYESSLDNDIDYTILIENKSENFNEKILTDLKNAIENLQAHAIFEHSYDFRSGYEAGLQYSIDILQNVLNRNESCDEE